MSGTCTYHALANAVIEQLDADGLNLNHNHVVQTLIKFCKGDEAVWPDKFHDCKDTIITMDEETKQHIAVTIKVVEKVHDFSPAEKHVLVYGLVTWLHTVYVKRQLMLRNAYECVNSWGDCDPHRIIEINRLGNVLYRVRAKWELASKS